MNKGDFSVKAFTITEAVIGMVVTGIIIAIVFVIFTITSERLLDFKEQNTSIMDLNRINYALEKDIFESSGIVGEDEMLLFKSHAASPVVYKINEDYMLRTAGDFNDTFRINVRSVYIDTLASKSGRLLYQRLKIKLKGSKEEYTVSFYKKIHTADLINRTNEY